MSGWLRSKELVPSNRKCRLVSFVTLPQGEIKGEGFQRLSQVIFATQYPLLQNRER